MEIKNKEILHRENISSLKRDIQNWLSIKQGDLFLPNNN